MTTFDALLAHDRRSERALITKEIVCLLVTAALAVGATLLHR